MPNCDVTIFNYFEEPGQCGMVLPEPFRGIEARRNSVETQQSATPQGLDQKLKMEEVVPKMARREDQMSDNSGVELDPTVEDRKRCMKNSSVLSCMDKSTKENCDRGSEVWIVFIEVCDHFHRRLLPLRCDRADFLRRLPMSYGSIALSLLLWVQVSKRPAEDAPSLRCPTQLTPLHWCMAWNGVTPI